MAPLASLADVKRILQVEGDDDARDAKLRGCLDAVESWAERKIRFVPVGSGMETYFDVYEDATITLPTIDCTVTKVAVYEYPSSAGIPLSPIELGLGHGYDLSSDGRLTFRPTLFVSPFEGTSSQRRLRQYSRVEVHFLATGVVPRAVTEGVAYLAAGYYTDGPRALAGITSEKIGDYSYTMAGAGDMNTPPSYVAQAYWFLTDYMRRSRIAVT